MFPEQALSEPIVIKRPAVVFPVIPDKPKVRTSRGDQTYRALSDSFAKQYGVDADRMWRIVICESGGRADAKNAHSSATGIVQILLSAHPDVTRAQAFDPAFSLEWMAKHLAAGRWSMWVCKG